MLVIWVVGLAVVGALALVIAALWNAGSRDPGVDELDPAAPSPRHEGSDDDEPVLTAGRVSLRMLWVLAITTPLVAIASVIGVIVLVMLLGPFDAWFAIPSLGGLFRALLVVLGMAAVWLTLLWLVASVRRDQRDQRSG